MGRKHEPTFRLVLTDSKNSTKSGRFKEILGAYDPRKSIDSIKADRVKYWLSQGVLPTGTVNNLLITHKIISGKKVNVLPKKTVAAKEVPPVAEEAPAPSPEAPTGDAPVAEELAAEPQEESSPSEVEEVPAPAPEAAPAPAEPKADEVV